MTSSINILNEYQKTMTARNHVKKSKTKFQKQKQTQKQQSRAVAAFLTTTTCSLPFCLAEVQNTENNNDNHNNNHHRQHSGDFLINDGENNNIKNSEKRILKDLGTSESRHGSGKSCNGEKGGVCSNVLPDESHVHMHKYDRDRHWSVRSGASRIQRHLPSWVRTLGLSL